MRYAIAVNKKRHAVCSPRGRKRTAKARPRSTARLPGNAAGGRTTASPGTSPGCDAPSPAGRLSGCSGPVHGRGPLGKRLIDFTMKDPQPRKCRNWATMLYKCRTAHGLAGRHRCPSHLAVAALLRGAMTTIEDAALADTMGAAAPEGRGARGFVGPGVVGIALLSAFATFVVLPDLTPTVATHYVVIRL